MLLNFGIVTVYLNLSASNKETNSDASRWGMENLCVGSWVAGYPPEWDKPYDSPARQKKKSRTMVVRGIKHPPDTLTEPNFFPVKQRSNAFAVKTTINSSTYLFQTACWVTKKQNTIHFSILKISCKIRP